MIEIYEDDEPSLAFVDFLSWPRMILEYYDGPKVFVAVRPSDTSMWLLWWLCDDAEEIEDDDAPPEREQWSALRLSVARFMELVNKTVTIEEARDSAEIFTGEDGPEYYLITKKIKESGALVVRARGPSQRVILEACNGLKKVGSI